MNDVINKLCYAAIILTFIMLIFGFVRFCNAQETVIGKYILRYGETVSASLVNIKGEAGVKVEVSEWNTSLDRKSKRDVMYREVTFPVNIKLEDGVYYYLDGDDVHVCAIQKKFWPIKWVEMVDCKFEYHDIAFDDHKVVYIVLKLKE